MPGGIESATANCGGWFLDPEATLGHTFALGELLDGEYALIPSVRVRYLHAYLDSYTENGSSAPLTVGSRTLDDLEERGELKLTRAQDFGRTLAFVNIHGGILGVQRIGGQTINATLLGQPIPFATPGNADEVGGFRGVGMKVHFGPVAICASCDYLGLSDSSHVISGEGAFEITF